MFTTEVNEYTGTHKNNTIVKFCSCSKHKV